MNPSSTRAPRPRGDERGSTTTTTTLTTTTTTRRDAMRARRAHRVPPWRPTESRSRPPLPRDRSRRDRSGATTVVHVVTIGLSRRRRDDGPIVARRRRHRDYFFPRVSAIVSVSAPSRRRSRPSVPHPRHPHRITRSRFEALRPIDRARVADRPDARRSLSIASRGFFSSRARRTIVSPSVCSSDDARSTRAFAVNQINHINHHHRPRARGYEDEDDRPVRCRPRPSLAFDFGTCPTPTLV